MKVLASLTLSLALVAGAALADDAVVLQTDWLASGDKAFVYVGKTKGFFEEEGLDVTIRTGRGSNDAITKLATGSADFATGAFSALIAAAAESPIGVKAIYSVYSKQPDATVVLADSDIQTLADLKGHTLAVAPMSGSSAVRNLVLRENGLADGDIDIKQVEPAVQAAMLASGQVDAIDSWVTTAPVAISLLASQGKEARILPWAQFGLEGYGLAVYTSDKMLAERPDVVARFLRALDKSVRFMAADPEAAARQVAELEPQIDVDIAIAQAKAAAPLIENDISARDGLGNFNPEILRNNWKTVALSQGYPLDKIDPMSLVAARP